MGKTTKYPKVIKTLGDIFRANRLHEKIDIVDLGKELRKDGCDITDSYLSRIETDEKNPSFEIAVEIAKKLKIDPNIISNTFLIQSLEETPLPTDSTTKLKIKEVITLLDKPIKQERERLKEPPPLSD